MKLIPFIKMVGAGNDFLVIDAQKKINYKQLAQKACCRSEGIGADGLLILERSRTADYLMRIINADGSEAEMCGNGARCMAAYIFERKSFRKKILRIETLAGTILAHRAGNEIAVRLSDPTNYIDTITLSINQRPLRVSYIDTGVPHVVCFVNDLEKIDVNALGPKIRFDKKFAPRGANVNFVEQIKKNLVHARTYERGVEAETRACGTGSVASAIVAFLKANPRLRSQKDAVMHVKTKSGEVLKIRFDLHEHIIRDVWLTGSARFIAQGTFYF